MPRDSEDDALLFREAVRDVQPLRAGNRQPPVRRLPPPRPRQREADERAVLDEMMNGPLLDTGDELGFRAPGVQDALYRKLRRGTYRVDGELDLHGLRSEAAKLEVARFLARCQAQGQRCVRIIHGKGLRSKGEGPVLKQRLDQWLRRHCAVLAFCSARPHDGGTGAVYVLLRRS
jgi:DNA-nicking Smr family endonuclease